MAANSQGNFDGKFEALDLAEFTKKQPWWHKLFGPEVGKLAATAVGGGLFLLQRANHTGYITVGWQSGKRRKDSQGAAEDP